MRNLSGKEAMAIMVESIGDAVGPHALSQFEFRVRIQMAKDHPLGGTFKDWLSSMARVIVDAGDEKADKGFQLGVRRIRELAAKR
jgi:hypothetical protein